MHMVGGVLGRECDIYLVLVPASMHEGDVRPIPRLAVRGLCAAFSYQQRVDGLFKASALQP